MNGSDPSYDYADFYVRDIHFCALRIFCDLALDKFFFNAQQAEPAAEMVAVFPPQMQRRYYLCFSSVRLAIMPTFVCTMEAVSVITLGSIINNVYTRRRSRRELRLLFFCAKLDIDARCPSLQKFSTYVYVTERGVLRKNGKTIKKHNFHSGSSPCVVFRERFENSASMSSVKANQYN